MPDHDFEPYEIRSILGGTQYRYRFPSQYGASVVRHQYSYGGDQGLWEVAVLDQQGALTYDTPVTSDVIGRCPWAEVQDILRKIASLPNMSAVDA